LLLIFLDDNEIASITSTNIKISNLKEEIIDKKITQIDWNKEQVEKGGFENFMLKEIFDQPTVFEDAIRGRFNVDEGTAVLGGLAMSLEQMREIKHFLTTIGDGNVS